MLHVVLLRPLIPWNTGAIGRTCLSFGARLVRLFEKKILYILNTELSRYLLRCHCLAMKLSKKIILNFNG